MHLALVISLFVSDLYPPTMGGYLACHEDQREMRRAANVRVVSGVPLIVGGIFSVGVAGYFAAGMASQEAQDAMRPLAVALALTGLAEFIGGVALTSSGRTMRAQADIMSCVDPTAAPAAPAQ